MSTNGVPSGNQTGDKPSKAALRPTETTYESATTTYQQAPAWSVDNVYVQKYYRRSVGVVGAFLSIVMLHNESANIWSHAVAFIFYAYLEFRIRHSPNRVVEQLAPFVLYRLAAMVCFLFSALFHTFYIVAEKAFSRLSRLDYLGILFFLGSGGYAFISINFDEQDFFLKFYVSTGVLLGCCLFREIVFNRNFNTAGYLRIRAVLFFCYAMSILFPFLHMYFLKGQSNIFEGFDHIFLVFACGVLMYGFKLPEYFLPGMFDLFPSHAFFHCFVFFGSWLYYCKLCVMASRKMI